MPLWGWASDHIDRGRGSLSSLASTDQLSGLLNRLVGLVFLRLGRGFSLSPSITGDLFGKTWATTSYGIVYTAKDMGALFAGAGAAWLFEKTGSWTKVFYAMIACDLIAAFLALFWLKGAAARTVRASESAASTVNVTEPMKA